MSWIGREHELYSGASPISLVEHCVTFRQIEGSYRFWDLYTTGQLVDGLQQKKNKKTKQNKTKTKKPKKTPVFFKRKWNHIVFSRVTILSFHPVLIIYISSFFSTYNLHPLFFRFIIPIPSFTFSLSPYPPYQWALKKLTVSLAEGEGY